MKTGLKTVGFISLLVSSLVSNAMAGMVIKKPNRSLSLSVGYLYQDDDKSIDALSDAGYSGISLNNDDKNIAVKLAYHYPIGGQWGGEIAYVDLGNIDFDPQITIPSGRSDAQAAQDIVDSLPLRGRGFTLKSTRQFTLKENFTLQLNAGLFFFNDERTATIGTTRVENNALDVGVVVGASTAFRLSKQMNLMLEWDHYNQKRNDVDVLSLGVGYLF